MASNKLKNRRVVVKGGVSKLKVLSPVNPKKRLLAVFELDKTLVRIRGKGSTPTPRPHLHKFLAAAYKNFTIIVWSSTSRKKTMAILRRLNLLNRDDFSITAVLSLEDATRVRTRKGKMLVKPLKKSGSWKDFPIWSNKNSVFIGHCQSSSLVNPRELIKAKVFRSLDDNFLKSLQKYLNKISRLTSFQGLIHRKMKF